MGGSSSSPRRVTITEDEATGTVQISEAVARRLLGKPELPDQSETTPQEPQPSVVPQQGGADVENLKRQYQERIAALEGTNNDIHKITKEQFAQAVNEVESKFVDQTATPVCENWTKKVLQCYQDNPDYTLHCSQEVKQFSACVQRQREAILQPIEARS